MWTRSESTGPTDGEFPKIRNIIIIRKVLKFGKFTKIADPKIRKILSILGAITWAAIIKKYADFLFVLFNKTILINDFYKIMENDK